MRKVIDGYLVEGMSGAGISRSLAELKLDVTPDVINRHKEHFEPDPTREPGTRKRDFAVIVRDKAIEQFESEGLDLRDKDHSGGINAGLKAQALLDRREERKAKVGTAELAWALLGLFKPSPETLLLDDGNTIEGEYEEVD